MLQNIVFPRKRSWSRSCVFFVPSCSCVCMSHGLGGYQPQLTAFSNWVCGAKQQSQSKLEVILTWNIFEEGMRAQAWHFTIQVLNISSAYCLEMWMSYCCLLQVSQSVKPFPAALTFPFGVNPPSPGSNSPPIGWPPCFYRWLKKLSSCLHLVHVVCLCFSTRRNSLYTCKQIVELMGADSYMTLNDLAAYLRVLNLDSGARE